MKASDIQREISRLEHLATEIKFDIETAIFSPPEMGGASIKAASIALDGIVELRDQLADLRIEIAR